MHLYALSNRARKFPQRIVCWCMYVCVCVCEGVCVWWGYLRVAFPVEQYSSILCVGFFLFVCLLRHILWLHVSCLPHLYASIAFACQLSTLFVLSCACLFPLTRHSVIEKWKAICESCQAQWIYSSHTQTNSYFHSVFSWFWFLFYVHLLSLDLFLLTLFLYLPALSLILPLSFSLK